MTENDETTKEHYRQRAATNALAASATFCDDFAVNAEAEENVRFLRKVAGDSSIVRILEIGCGNGHLASTVCAELSRVVPFVVVRLFWVQDVPQGKARGGHAHVAGRQFLICVAGSIVVDADDGAADRSIGLASGSALHVPPMIFSTERFAEPGSVFLVLCDRPYERDDYAHDRRSFVARRQSRAAS